MKQEYKYTHVSATGNFQKDKAAKIHAQFIIAESCPQADAILRMEIEEGYLKGPLSDWEFENITS